MLPERILKSIDDSRGDYRCLRHGACAPRAAGAPRAAMITGRLTGSLSYDKGKPNFVLAGLTTLNEFLRE